ncbi:MAG: 5,5-dehydrodivanillate O-demethylase oxygenase subunit [Chloroflexota bacterium]|jgi:5,5'-dehydrodivanillate O-demethylase|nr:5,5-dehydrodivanillate O-demethylase oxygenase subunit [Chloroflexota bacterium]
MVAMDERPTDTQPQGEITYQDFLKTGPGTLAGRYLRMFWQPVYRSQDLATGSAVPIKMMSEDFTLVRGDSGQAQLLAQRCAHRGSMLVTGWVEGDAIRCSYHGWKYDLTGQCVDQPAEPVPFCNTVRVRSYPTQEYLGLIFAYLGEGEPPAFPRLPDYEDPEYTRDVEYLIWPCNYFTQLDNAVDQTHTSIAHWQFGRPIPEALVFHETDWGLDVSTQVDGAVRPPSHFLMPNAHEWGGAPRGDKVVWNYACGWRVPVDDQHHARFAVEVIASKGEAAQRRQARRVGGNDRALIEVAEAVMAGKVNGRELTPERYPEHQLTNIQDYYNLVGLGDVASQPPRERLGRSDLAIVALRGIWARELRAVAEGRPIKRWQRPDALWGHVWEVAADHVVD